MKAKQLAANLREYGKRTSPHQQRCIEQAAKRVTEDEARINALNLRVAYLESRLADQRQFIEQQDATIGNLMAASTAHMESVTAFMQAAGLTSEVAA
jgi:chromosome condensin MukBEF ATPase and DNA-binding subunit MukB